MGYLELLESVSNNIKKVPEFVVDEKRTDITEDKSTEFYSRLSLSEIKKRDIAFQRYSEYLDDSFWICSNDEMIEQIKKDDPESIVYHIDEIVEINKLKPDNKSLKSIHEAKKLFKNSKIIMSDKN